MASLSKSAPPALTSAAHRHTLTLVHTGGAVFKCDGCRQPGADKARYRCHPCDFDLHMPCALPPPHSAIAHPRFGGRHFTFFTSPGAGNSRHCDACGDHVRGFVYRSQGGLDLHPCCASLKETIVVNNGLELHLYNLQAPGACELCGQGQNGPRGKFWTYASFHGSGGRLVNMHVACLLYGDHTRNPGTGLASSISTPSPIQTPFTPIQMMTPSHSHSQMVTTGGNVVATVQTFNTFYSFGKILTEIADAFAAGDAMDAAGLLG